jgi:hypothetical protein
VFGHSVFQPGVPDGFILCDLDRFMKADGHISGKNYRRDE